MKHYQDTVTGSIFAFEDDFNPFESNYRNIPKTLSENIIENPSEFHVWHNGNWIHEQDKPENYEEPISCIPSYNPAWITFLFKAGTIIFNEKDKFEINLEQINTNTYNGKELSKIITTLPNFDDGSTLPILVSVDGSISVPVNDIYSTREIAVNKMNEVISALFLGGINLQSIHLGDLELGTLLEGEPYNFSYFPSEYNRLRNNWASLSELSTFLSSNYIYSNDIRNAYDIGMDFIKSINFTPIFLVQGYNSLQLWKTTDALSNLWIIVEQLTNILLENLSIFEKNRIFQKLKITQAEKIHMKHKVLKEGNVISDLCFEILNSARDIRNDLMHEGKSPEHSIVENLWITLFELLELASGKKLDNLYQLTVDKQTNNFIRFHSNDYDKQINPKKTDFNEWKNLHSEST